MKLVRICNTPRCGNPALNKRFKCSKCRSREYTLKSPLRRAYLNLKSNAKRRGKVFELSFEWFCVFAIPTDYVNKRGITSKGYHIDRILPYFGYFWWNIQVITNRENVKKQSTIDRYWDGAQMHFYTTTRLVSSKAEEIEGVPF